MQCTCIRVRVVLELGQHHLCEETRLHASPVLTSLQAPSSFALPWVVEGTSHACSRAIGASRPPGPFQGVACRLGSFIIKTASSKKMFPGWTPRSSSRTSSTCTRTHFRPRERRAKEDSDGAGPACKARDQLHTGGRNDRLVGWRMWWSLGTDNDPPVDST